MNVTSCIACHREFAGVGLQCPVCRGTPKSAPPAAPDVARKPAEPPAMTAAELRYRDILEARVRAGEVARFWFEAITFRVGAGRSTYRPDFVAELVDGSVEVVEVKGGYIHEDSRVKFKAAAQMYPWATWRMVQIASDGTWRTVYDFPARSLAVM